MATRVRVYYAAIQSHFEPGGGVYRDANNLGNEAVLFARQNVHSRTGVLRASIQKYGRGVMSRYGYSITVVARAPYALFVEEGTTGPITAKTARFLKVPTRKYGRETRPRAEVRGQAAQHYLRKGMNEALTRHGYGDLGDGGTVAGRVL